MSKAFTRESDDTQEETLQPRPVLPPGVQNYITAEGADRLRNQLADLTEQKRAALQNPSPDESTRVAEVRNLETRLRQVQQILKSVVVARPSSKEPDRVAFGSTVTVRQANGDEATYRIVGVDEMDLDRGQISWRSPLARALFSRRTGDEFTFTSPAGTETLEILSVKD
jgi:transcription elongation factor GreB